MREIHRPCTRFLGLFSNLPCGNAVVHFIVQFENMTDVTFCPHTYKIFIIFELFEFLDFVNVGIITLVERCSLNRFEMWT